MYPHEEAAFEQKAEKDLKHYREIPNGRSFLWNKYREQHKDTLKQYRKNFDEIFPKAPGHWFKEVDSDKRK